MSHQEAHQQINELLERLQILDGPGYKAERGASGTTLHIDLPAAESPGDSYQGHFKLANASTAEAQQVTVIDGIDADAVNCGQVIAGLTTIDVPKATLAITAKSWICLKLTYTTTYVAELVALTAAPVQANGIYYRLLGIVDWEGAAIKSVQQIQHGDIDVAGRAV